MLHISDIKNLEYSHINHGDSLCKHNFFSILIDHFVSGERSGDHQLRSANRSHVSQLPKLPGTEVIVREPHHRPHRRGCRHICGGDLRMPGSCQGESVYGDDGESYSYCKKCHVPIQDTLYCMVS